MPDGFSYDVFLSHSAKDKKVVRALAECLRADGVKVWFDDWEIRVGDSIPAKIEEGLEKSRVLVLCMSVHAFGSDWAQLESGTFRFRDPLNKERRLLPLRLDEAPIKGSLAQFPYVDWLPLSREEGYAKLLAICRPAAVPNETDAFPYDVFLSYSAKDKNVVREIAERLRVAGLRVWFDDWMLKPGDNIPAKIEEGLEGSRALVLCMSANAFSSNWASIETQNFRFRDPLNKERRFLPLRLDDAPIKGSLAQFLYIDWVGENREQEFAKLLEACKPPAAPPSSGIAPAKIAGSVPRIELGAPQSPTVQGDFKLFISYRRDDTAAIAGRLYDRLASHFGEPAVFFDIDAIPFGINFVEVIKANVEQCSVLLALIGGQWLARDSQGNRRIDDHDDFVRIEIESALARSIPVIPVLVGGIRMPKPQELPESLAELARRNGAQLDVGRDFHHHVNQLIVGISRHIRV